MGRSVNLSKEDVADAYETPAFAELAALTLREASGEFIAAAPRCEVHLYLQQGKLAWGYSTTSRGAFRARIESECGVSRAEFAEIVETCRRERAPLGQTLVRLRLASAEQVGRALQQQIADTIEVLRELGEVRAVFLSRDSAWREYDRSLTFSLDAVTTRLPTPRPAPEPLDVATVASAVLEALPGLEWVAVANGSAVLHEEPKGQASETPDIHRATVARGARLVLSRNSVRTIVGVALSDEESSLWGRLSYGVSQSEALSVFSRFGVQAPQEAQCPEGPPLRDGPPSPPFDAIAHSLMREAEVWAVVLVNRDGTRGATLAPSGVSIERLLPDLVARSALLASEPVGHPSALSVLAIADGSGWWFGAPLRDATVWILARPSLAAGLGIALLRSMVLQLNAITAVEG